MFVQSLQTFHWFPPYLPFNPDHFGEMNIHFSFYPRILWAPLKRREFYGSFFYGSLFFAFLCFRTSSRCTCKYIRKHRKFNFVPICIQISLPHVHLWNEFLGFLFSFFLSLLSFSLPGQRIVCTASILSQPQFSKRYGQ